MAAAVVLTMFVVPLALAAAVVDVATGALRRSGSRLPRVRLLGFGICWAWLETAGVLRAGLLWLSGRAGDVDAHFRLQRWWADRLMQCLRATCGVEVDVDGVEALRPGGFVLLVRHASLADSLLTAWVVTENAGLRPRVVLKRELLADPCLDIVGHRLPNCFVDRDAADSGPELAAIAEMAHGLGDDDVAIIFPEGTRASAAKRTRALERIAEGDPARAARLAGLHHLIPPRPAGSRALIEGSGGAEVVLGWHTGFDGLDDFRGILTALARPRTPVHIHFERVGHIPTDPSEFAEWLDAAWQQMDRSVCVEVHGRLEIHERVDDHEQVADVDAAAGDVADLGDRAGDRRAHRVLHLHRLDDDERLVLDDDVTDGDVHRDDRAGQRGDRS